MAKKKKLDAGVQYLNDIYFNAGKGYGDLYGKLNKHYDRKKVEELLKQYQEIVGHRHDMSEFYAFKNSTYEISTAFSECFDGVIFRQAVNYVDAHKDAFGKSILEVGCDCGFMTLYLAKTFPEAKITAIDRCAEAVENTKKRLEEHGITNVACKVIALADMEEQFDTVFSMRVMQENWEGTQFQRGCEFLSVQIDTYKDLVKDYAVAVTNSLKENGVVVSFERTHIDPLLCGWMKALNAEGCAVNAESFAQISISDDRGKSSFTAFCAKKGEQKEADAIENFWYELLGEPNSNKVFYDWHALRAAEQMAETVIHGGVMQNLLGIQEVKFALYSLKEDPEHLLYYSTLQGGNKAEIVPIDRKDALIELIDQQFAQGPSWGLVVKELTLSDGVEVIGDMK